MSQEPHPHSSIDAAAFPHILESIISFADPSVLRTFRRTSHHFNNLIYIEAAHHLVLNSSGHLTSKDQVHVFSPPPRGQTTNPYDRRSSFKTPSDRLKAVLQHAKVLDIHSRVLHHQLLFPLSLDVVRFFVPRPNMYTSPSHCTETYFPRCHTAIYRVACQVLPGFTRHVFYSPTIIPDILVWSKMHIPQIVIIRRPCDATSTFETFWRGWRDFRRNWRLLHNESCKEVTFVNAPWPAEHREMIQTVTLRDEEGRPKPQWRFLSTEEYAASLSEMERRLILW